MTFELEDSPEPINLLTLRFADAGLEAAYSRSYAERQQQLDWVACCVSNLQLLAGTLYILFRGLHMRPPGNVLLIGSGVFHGVHTLLLRSKRFKYAQHRTPVLASLLAVVRVLTALTVPHTPSDTSPATRLMYKSGIIPLCWYGIAFPLLFRHQMVAQLLAVGMYQAFLTVPACEVLSLDPKLLGLLEWIWTAVRTGLSLTLQVQGISVQQSAMSAALAHSNPFLLCWSTLSFLLLLLGALLPAPVWYCLELRSRARFYSTWQQQQQQQPQLQQQGVLCMRMGGRLRSSGSSTNSGSNSRINSNTNNTNSSSGVGSSSSSGPGAPLGGSGDFAVVATQPLDYGNQQTLDQAFQVPLVSLLMTMAVAAASSSLVLMSYGPQLLRLQLQWQQWRL